MVDLADRSWRDLLENEPTAITDARNNLYIETTLAETNIESQDKKPLNPHNKIEAEKSLAVLVDTWKQDCITLETQKKMEIKQKFALSCYGDPQKIRAFLFQLSNAMKENDFKEISMAYNPFSGIY